MTNPFFERPIVNSPYEHPRKHWELDQTGQPTGALLEHRRRAEFITPIPKPKKRKTSSKQEELEIGDRHGISTKEQKYDLTSIINEVRQSVDTWRQLAPSQWQVTPETARLLQHWRHHEFGGVRPFFCQVEAVETAIWFTEVAPHLAAGKRLIENLKRVNAASNPAIERLALKLATGAGKTTVMAMLIAWQTLNAVRRPGSKHFSRGFLIVTPGLTIRDRLRVLQPNDPDSYYSERELVPHDMLEDMKKARIVITNYHAFKRRDRLELSAGGRALLTGRTGPDPYNPVGSTSHVRFPTSKTDRWDTSGPPPKNHVNWVVLDSDWEAELCRIVEGHPRVVAYTKNHNLGFDVPYRFGSELRRYRPDFIVLVNDGRGSEDLLHLVIEIKGYRREDAKDKKLTMETYWVPG